MVGFELHFGDVAQSWGKLDFSFEDFSNTFRLPDVKYITLSSEALATFRKLPFRTITFKGENKA